MPGVRQRQRLLNERDTMTFVHDIWRRLPVVVRAVLTGVAAAVAGTVSWTLLVSANTRHQPALPWAAPVMAAYLLVYWRYLARRQP